MRSLLVADWSVALLRSVAEVKEQGGYAGTEALAHRGASGAPRSMGLLGVTRANTSVKVPKLSYYYSKGKQNFPTTTARENKGAQVQALAIHPCVPVIPS
jgi:hypothetical protein